MFDCDVVQWGHPRAPHGHHIGQGPPWTFKLPDTARTAIAGVAAMVEATPGVQWDMVLHKSRTPPVATTAYHWMGDASGSQAPHQAMAGYMHGYYWELEVRPEWKHLHITALEFLCVLGHLLIFGPLLVMVWGNMPRAKPPQTTIAGVWAIPHPLKWTPHWLWATMGLD